MKVRELLDWCRKYLYLPRITHDQLILDALVNLSAALSGESTFYLADSFNEGSGRYQVLSPQQSSSNHLPSLKSLIVKEDVASRQAPEMPPSAPIGVVTVGSGLDQKYHPQVEELKVEALFIAQPTPAQPVKKTTFVASLKLEPCGRVCRWETS